jgi:hypothetical protein
MLGDMVSDLSSFSFILSFSLMAFYCPFAFHFNIAYNEVINPIRSFVYFFQIAGPFSFRVDSGVAVDLKNQDWSIRVDEPVFAIEYALQVLGSAKAVAWYSPKHQEFMVELRFFET